MYFVLVIKKEIPSLSADPTSFAENSFSFSISPIWDSIFSSIFSILLPTELLLRCMASTSLSSNSRTVLRNVDIDGMLIYLPIL